MDRSERRRLLAVAAATGVAFGMTYPFVPLLASEFGASPLMAGVIAGSNVLTMIVIDAFGMRAIPRLNTRHVLTVALVFFTVGSAVAAASPNLATLFCSRLIEGVGLALFMSAVIHLVARGIDAHERARALGRFNATWFGGAAIGPFLGGALTALAAGADGLRLAFAACAVVSGLCALLAWFVLDDHPSEGHAEVRMPSLGPLLRQPRLRGAVLLGGLSEATRDAFMMVLIPLAAATAGLTDVAVGLTLTILALTDVASMHASGHVADRYGRARPLVVTFVAAACVSLAAVRVDDAMGFFVIAFALGATLGTVWVVPPAMLLDLAPDPEAAVAGYRVCSDIGLFAGTVGAGALFQVVGPEAAFIGMAIALAAGALVVTSVGETHRSRSPLVSPLEVSP